MDFQRKSLESFTDISTPTTSYNKNVWRHVISKGLLRHLLVCQWYAYFDLGSQRANKEINLRAHKVLGIGNSKDLMTAPLNYGQTTHVPRSL